MTRCDSALNMFGTILQCNREKGHDGAHIPTDDEEHKKLNLSEFLMTAGEIKIGS